MSVKKINHKKIFLSLAGIIVLLFILSTYFVKTSYKRPKGDYVETIVIQDEINALMQVNSNLSDVFNHTYEQDFLLYKEFCQIEEALHIHSDEITENKYRSDSFVLKSDWDSYFCYVISEYGQGKITKEQLKLIAIGENVKDETGASFDNNSLFTSKGVYYTDRLNMSDYSGNEIVVFQYENKILDIYSVIGEKIELKNAYIISEKENMQFFWNHHEVTLPQKDNFSGQDQIADLTIDNSGVIDATIKNEIVGGKIVRLDNHEIEIEDGGSYELSEDLQIYQMFGNLCSKTLSDLRIGYAFSDFVVSNGKIEAGLIMKEDDMNTIRVLIKSAEYENRFHETIKLSCDTDYTVQFYKNGKEEGREEKKSGDEFDIQRNTLKDSDERLKITPSALSGNFTIHNLTRSQKVPVYRGSLEIEKQEEGLVLINELLLEEYLYKVVPSEMPSSYPYDALKAQAICARTYAYDKMIHAGLPQFGAHVDDSAGFQVYNNISMQSETTKAVKATLGEILWYEEAPALTYYYSTSCGAGTDTSVWGGFGSDNPEYLQPQMIDRSQDIQKAEKLKDEESFREFIASDSSDCYEKEEGWFRWTYEVNEINEEHLLEVLKKRYDSNPDRVLTKNSKGEFESKAVGEIGKIKDISIVKRNAGGVAEELLIEGTKACIKVISELNIRYILNDGSAKVVRQTGDAVSSPSLLPSGYFVIDTGKEDGYVLGYKLSGGGFGHGVGMSQNAAKDMSLLGMNYQDILSFFYKNSTIKTIQTKGE